MKNSFLLAALIVLSSILGVIITITYIKWTKPVQNPCEYQFIVTDDSVEVFDNHRIIGTIKLEGQLDSLITMDNQ